MRRTVVAFVFVSLPLASALTYAQAPSRLPAGPSQSGVDLRSMNRTVNPCTDFFQFACCGKWQPKQFVIHEVWQL